MKGVISLVTCEKVLKVFLANHTLYHLDKQLVELARRSSPYIGERSVAMQRPVLEMSEFTNRRAHSCNPFTNRLIINFVITCTFYAQKYILLMKLYPWSHAHVTLLCLLVAFSCTQLCFCSFPVILLYTHVTLLPPLSSSWLSAFVTLPAIPGFQHVTVS